jgi:hypothetical protein
VLVVQVDVVHTEPLQGLLAALPHVGRITAHPELAPRGDDAELGREHHLVAPTRDGAADQFLVRALAVHVRGVDQRHAQVESAVQGRDRLDVVVHPVGVAHPHAAKPLRADLEVPQLARRHVVHADTPSLSPAVPAVFRTRHS